VLWRALCALPILSAADVRSSFPTNVRARPRVCCRSMYPTGLPPSTDQPPRAGPATVALVAAHLPLPTTPVATGASTGRSEAPCTSRTGAAPGAAGLVTSPGTAPQAAMWASSTQPMRATVRGLSPRSTAAAAAAGATKALGQSGGVQTLGVCACASVCGCVSKSKCTLNYLGALKPCFPIFVHPWWATSQPVP
jgi:hypothetical protein